MSEFLYEVGDEYEGSPIQQSRFISEVLAHGGLVGIDGNIVRILYLPGKGSIFDAEEAEAAPAPEEAKAGPSAETIKETQASIDQIEKFNEEVKEATPEANEAVEVNVSGEFEEVLHTEETSHESNDPAAENFENEGGAVEVPKPAPKRAGRPRKSPAKEAE